MKMVYWLKDSQEGMVIQEKIFLENLKTIKDIPKKINSNKIPNLLEIRCEIYKKKSFFPI